MFRFVDLGAPYRFIVALAGGQLLAAVLLLFMRHRFDATIMLGGAGQTAIAPIALGCSLLLMVAGLTYILYAAAFIAHLMRWTIFAAYGIILAFPIAATYGQFGSFALCVIAVATFAIVSFYARAQRRSGRSQDTARFHGVVFALLFVCVACAFVIPMLCMGVSGSAGVAGEQMSAVAILILPALLLAGADLAEIAQVVADYAGRWIAPSRVLPFLGVGCIAIAVLLLVPRTLLYHSPRWMVNEVLLLGTFAALIALVLWLRPAPLRGPVRFKRTLALAAVAIIYTLNLAQSIILVPMQIHQPAYVAQDFTMDYPSGWSAYAVNEKQKAIIIRAYRFTSPHGAWLDVVRGAEKKDPLPAGMGSGRVKAMSWTVAGPSSKWRIFAVFPAVDATNGSEEARLMRDTFHAASGQRSPYVVRLETITALGGGIAALVGAIALIFLRKVRTISILFAALVAFAWCFYHPVLFTQGFRIPEVLAPIFDMHEIQAFVALASVASLLWLAVARRKAARHGAVLLFVLNLALVFIAVLYDVYGNAGDIGEEFGTMQGFIVLVALSWDALMSGETFTNGHTVALPRAARVCMFFGYIVIVSAVVVFLASIHLTHGGRVIDSFDAEYYPQRAMLLVGVPMILALFAARFTRLLAIAR